MPRTGDEPIHARSPLRMRFWLALWGTALMIALTVGFALTERPGWAAGTAALAALTAVDLLLIRRHIRQGPHYQPGPDIPPYAPADPPADGDGRTKRPGEDPRDAGGER
ncbi:DUF6343 family protein [Streptomyces polyrhachis]|uniref:DUF6343 family protein n=1 Tax=Streptomyces polyrhachis TaxID=1282885 RepID=A0ABW2G7D6_9ACTN